MKPGGTVAPPSPPPLPVGHVSKATPASCEQSRLSQCLLLRSLPSVLAGSQGGETELLNHEWSGHASHLTPTTGTRHSDPGSALPRLCLLLGGLPRPGLPSETMPGPQRTGRSPSSLGPVPVGRVKSPVSSRGRSPWSPVKALSLQPHMSQGP